ncbi:MULTISPECIES: DUF1428 domain-containing protein [Halocynthiibacter]|uniref:DUF1428 domain-containing protein n=1 Tax=Halocynthiibacter halioticoli TaxID=2986804 RepID=A0AAE3IWM9_9RHOB|nr:MULTISPECIES: DUF1428 domain-containing protein [Halocynthiibacter]MCV6823582.1 DUF1428 domain-containing protein [Halocynthiibacter halioticoli]MCW4056583.1 DUF1428 domain-containing protein [Halocynthiibacter sp. SDUM655004]
MAYVDGFVAAVPDVRKQEFIEHAEIIGKVFIEHGAIECVECWGDEVPEGEITSFPRAVQKKDDETIVFSWVLWPDKATRDAGMKKTIDDPRAQPDVAPMPFDGKRMLIGGFEQIVKS